MSNFQDFNLSEKTFKFIEANHFKTPSKIQAKVIPLALKGRDIVGKSHTGTGKTHAFLIPVFEKVDSSINRVQVVISAPTRELAHQLYERAKLMQEIDPNLKIKLITGGNDKNKLNEGLKQQPHIVIGTPGRMRDLFLNDKTLRLDTADLLIVDEADMTLEFGFLEDIDMIASRMKNLQMMSFSATIPKRLQQFLDKYMHNPAIIEIAEDPLFKPRVENILIPCKHFSYQEMLLRLLKTFDPYLCMIFANTKEEVASTAKLLRNNGYGVLEMHAGLSTRERKNAMKQLNSGEYQYIVCSDIAARGIDIDGVSHVISMGFPRELDFFIHRSGRTGRAGKEGICFALYNKKDENTIRLLQKRGIHFEHQKVAGTNRYDLKPIFSKRVRKDDPLEKEISKIVNNKKVKVKPGYKKKRKEQVAKLKRKAKREMIQQEIRKQAKEKNKAKQRMKREQNENW